MTPLNAPARPMHFRKMWDVCLRLFSWISVAIALGGMAWILFSVFKIGAGIISWDFIVNPIRAVTGTFTEEMAAYQTDFDMMKDFLSPEELARYTPPIPVGVGNAIMGTLSITFFASLITVPLAILAGIYIAEFGKNGPFSNFLRFSANVLMGIPSIIIGFFVYAVVVKTTGNASGFAGSVALSIIMFPVIMRTTEDMMSMVPVALRESALALGMTRMRTTICIVARSAKNGLTTGVLLALARVSGETAPLLMTAKMAESWPGADSFFTNVTANLPVLINNFSNDTNVPAANEVAWGAAMVICTIILLINVATRILFTDKHKR